MRKLSALRWNKDPEAERPTYIIKNFFDKNSKAYVGNLKHMPKIVSGHSYHAHLRNPDMVSVHKAVAAEAEKYGVEFQQSGLMFALLSLGLP